jgi:hypothetical protein
VVFPSHVETFCSQSFEESRQAHFAVFFFTEPQTKSLQLRLYQGDLCVKSSIFFLLNCSNFLSPSQYVNIRMARTKSYVKSNQQKHTRGSFEVLIKEVV